MEAKYYTMTEEDICIGLEFEVPVYNGKDEPETYIETTFNCNTIDLFFKKTHGIIFSLPENCRIKYLDSQDIEELGWKYSNLSNTYSIELNDMSSVLAKGIWLDIQSNNRIKIVDCRLPRHEVVFNGYIKNKSELRKLMKILNITN